MANLINESEIRSTWSPIIESATGVNESEKLAWMSTYCHNHKLYEDANIMSLDPTMNLAGMGAAKFPSAHGVADGSGDKSPSLLPLAMQVAAQTVGLDLVPVVPMAGPMGLLSYLDFTYEGGRLDNAVAPTYIKVGVDSDEDLAAVIAEIQALTDDKIPASAGNYGAYTLVGTSRIDGKMIFKVGDIVAADVAADVALALASLTEDATANGVELVKALEDHIKGFVAADENGNPFSREAGESTPDKVMGLSLFSKSVAAETFQVAAAVTREQVQDLKQFGVDAVAQVESVLTNELTQSINQHILGAIRAQGTSNVTKAFGASTSFDIALADASALAGGETVASEQRKILTQILAAANLIANRGRRGAGNFAVVGAQVATVLQSVSGFVANPMNNTFTQSAGAIYPLGSVAGINVYTDPTLDWADYQVAVGRKGDGNGPGLVFMPYLMAESVQTIAEGTMAPKVAVKSRFALVEAGFHPETQYVTFNISNGSGSWTNLINLA
jgi:hypothetical protein